MLIDIMNKDRVIQIAQLALVAAAMLLPLAISTKNPLTQPKPSLKKVDGESFSATQNIAWDKYDLNKYPNMKNTYITDMQSYIRIYYDHKHAIRLEDKMVIPSKDKKGYVIDLLKYSQSSMIISMPIIEEKGRAGESLEDKLAQVLANTIKIKACHITISCNPQKPTQIIDLALLSAILSKLENCSKLHFYRIEKIESNNRYIDMPNHNKNRELNGKVKLDLHVEASVSKDSIATLMKSIFIDSYKSVVRHFYISINQNEIRHKLLIKLADDLGWKKEKKLGNKYTFIPKFGPNTEEA
ncbi:hypothetical protein NEFER03_1989 [Nematocida sp. LUAm3]|nr:hypothetical protein NEFER03_1989 [Nematocida sp. LUAm3]KAI5176073.1 hypothetical protein NEFER02_1907 [Nematocida sp. LUAm2]KAI5177117.1 hypothetical protein NEFER01_0392 [Nematocida sp. LUAm1]